MSSANVSKQSQWDSSELRSIERDFIKLRILHYTNAGRVRAADIEQQLSRYGCAVTSTSLGALLGRMRRLGWIKIGLGCSEQEWLITVKGRQALEAAKDRFVHVADEWLTPH